MIGFQFEPESARPLLLAANRDEFHERPTEPAHWWPTEPSVLAGRDRLAGGTWLAVSRGGRLAAVTNVREMSAGGGSRSRGELPLEFVTGSRTAGQFSRRVLERGARYGGFNLLAYDGRELWWCSNRAHEPMRVAPGIHALSNHLLDTPWPKVSAMRGALARLDRSADAATLFETLLVELQDRRRPPGELPDTGIGRARERLLAPAFICSRRYGTRSSTLVMLDRGGGHFLEVSYDPDGAVSGRVSEVWV